MTTTPKRRNLAWVLIPMILLILGITLFLIRQQKKGIAQDPRLESLARLVADSSVKPEFYFENGFPRWFSGRVVMDGADSVERARNFLEAYKDLYGQSDPNLELHVQKTGGAVDEFVVFYQAYKGFQVYGGQLLVMLDGAEVVATLGPLLPGGLAIDTSPIVEVGEAEELARTALEAPSAQLAGETTPVVYDPALFGEAIRDPRLAWQVALWAGGTWNVLVDARTGEILLKNPFSLSGYDLDLEDANYNSAENSSCYWGTTDDDWIGDEDGILAEYLGDIDATNMWHHAKNAYAYYMNNFGVDGYDLDGGVVEIYVHAGVDNAQWLEGAGCDLIEFADGWVSWDTLVHEYTHGVISHTSQLSASGQSGSLNEAFADTMAMLADPDDWDLSEDRTNGAGAIRHYDSFSLWHMSQYDPNGNRYTNMGIPCTAGYKLAVGGTHNSWPGSGLGRKNMVELFYNVMVNIPNGASATFMDTRNLAVSLATTHWSAQNTCAVKNAFAAVGLGYGDWECDGILDPDLTDSDGDWHIDAKDNCPQAYNPWQEDLENDGIGDACDPDDDGDLYDDTEDNCPRRSNPMQEDSDKDGKGDACDDEDGDHVLDVNDNCLQVANTNQKDKDQDGVGDACEQDLDGDGVNELDASGDPLDNCPFVFNPDQADTDQDSIGDACDACPNTPDEVLAYTNVPGHLQDLGAYPQPLQPDSDDDGIPDACDNNLLLGKAPWREAMTNLEPGAKEIEVHVHLEPGVVERAPIPFCPQDRDGWYSQGARERLVLVNRGPTLGMWVTDQAGRSVARPVMQGEETILEFQPWGGRSYFLNFILPAGEDRADFDLEFSLLCYAKALAQATGTPVPFNPEAIGSLIILPMTATATPWTPTPTLTLSPAPTLTPTATRRPWPTLTFTPTLTPYIQVNCGQYKDENSCRANEACEWVNPFVTPPYCKNK